MIRKGLRPSIKVTFDVPIESGGFRRVLPFRRSWIAIGVIAVFDLLFLIPAITTLLEAIRGWSRLDTLFDLVGALFLSAWLLGWIFAPLALTTILALAAFGREVISAKPGRFVLFFGLPGLGVAAEYDVARMRNLRLMPPLGKSAKSWRGRHLAFHYGANRIAFGTDIDESEVADIRRSIETASGRTMRDGEATPDELEGKWALARFLNKEPVATAAIEPLPIGEPVTLTSLSTLALIIANLAPLLGTAYLGWNLSDVMVLYWSESAVIGLFNIVKIAVIGRWLALVAAPFFLSHFGAFMAVHFLFIYGFFVQGPSDMSAGNLSDVAGTFTALWPALAMLFASHALSFSVNFLGRQEYRQRTMENLMSEPYSRIIFMHLVLIFGGGLTLVLGEPTPVLLLVIVLKMWVDVRAHLKQRAAADK